MAYLLHHILVESARRYPDREALRFEGNCLTYSELDGVTNQVARALISAGVRRGDRVGIYLHKSLASVISIFGILKAGGVYVPMDPNAPQKRLGYIANNCGIQTVLTTSEKLPLLQQMSADGSPVENVLLLDGDADPSRFFPNGTKIIHWEEILRSAPDPLPLDRTIETDLAYILYTSGSTGDPKGVMISHRTIFTFINWSVESFQMTFEDRVTSHAPIHFDLSTFDIFATVRAGGTVILIPEKLSIFPTRLVKLLQDERVTITYMVPSILAMMVNHGKLDRADLSALRIILFAGEVFPIKYLRELVQMLPGASYYNLYGPTETNVCTYYKVQAADLEPERTQPVPIGVACENMEVFAIDDAGQRVDRPGVEGELWVRGSCVAQGYWGDPEKTALRFVRNPYQPHFDEIAYRTGDIVTLAEDGVNWKFIGRRDHMIKSRGYRIELGEIESTLYGHAGVKEAAVIAVPDDLIGNRIKAFVVPQNGDTLSVIELQNHLEKILPRYMVPESIEIRESLPKTSTGKIHRPMLAQSVNQEE